jgi:ribosome-associated protein
MALSELRVTARRVVPPHLLSVQFARGGGPGGQNVNKVETKVDLRVDLQGLRETWGEADVARVTERLSARLDGEGRLQIVCSEHRSLIIRTRADSPTLSNRTKARTMKRAIREKIPPKKPPMPSPMRERTMAIPKKKIKLIVPNIRERPSIVSVTRVVCLVKLGRRMTTRVNKAAVVAPPKTAIKKPATSSSILSLS